MNPEELKAAGWSPTIEGFTRNGQHILIWRDDVREEWTTRTVHRYDRIRYTIKRRGPSELAALASLGRARMMTGRTVREWALTPTGAIA